MATWWWIGSGEARHNGCAANLEEAAGCAQDRLDGRLDWRSGARELATVVWRSGAWERRRFPSNDGIGSG
jgi:hypothetical protein